MKQSLCSVTSNVEISPGVRLMWIEAPDIAMTAQPGQFITIRCENSVLRRPLSIHQVAIASGNVIASEAKQFQMGGDCRHGFLNPCEGEIAILFQVVGKGTLWLSQRQTGDEIDILGPLGKGFSIPSARQSKNLLLVAGGIGIAPLIFLAQYASLQHRVTLIHGVSIAAQLYPFSSLPVLRSTCHSERSEESHSSGQAPQTNPPPSPNEVRFIPVTEDGSMGKKGVVTDVLPDFLDWADQIYACGPIDMYKRLAAISYHLKATPCQVSLEVRMGCGFGACYGCTINTKMGLKRVCRDGPVFELDDIIWEEVRI